MKSENKKTNESKSSNANSKKIKDDSGNIQYIEFVEFE
jgi:hypothetical protein